MTLDELGWSEVFQDQLQEEDSTMVPARVSRRDASGFTLLSEAGELKAHLRGAMSNQAQSAAELPVVGDWVLCSPDPVRKPSSTIIHRRLERRTSLSRRQAGEKEVEQVLAANVDSVFILAGLDREFNVRRIMRYLVLVSYSGANAVILLNKADLETSREKTIRAMASVGITEPICFISALDGTGLEQLEPFLGKGKTVVLLGSSGTGKSTLTNRLLNDERLQTGAVRETDSRGRHTTSFREMLMLPGGGLIIDTPGLREIQLWGDITLLDDYFSDVSSLADQCRFRDCGHQSEPRCAVKAALDQGQLSRDRLAIYLQLRDELDKLRN